MLVSIEINGEVREPERLTLHDENIVGASPNVCEAHGKYGGDGAPNSNSKRTMTHPKNEERCKIPMFSSHQAVGSQRRRSAVDGRCRSQLRTKRLIVALSRRMKCKIAFQITILPCWRCRLQRIGDAGGKYTPKDEYCEKTVLLMVK